MTPYEELREKATLAIMAKVPEGYGMTGREAQEYAHAALILALTHCAEIAEAHKGEAERQRRNKTARSFSPEALDEIWAEERGEDIASEIIARSIRALLPKPEQGEG
jgi:hypothetical protein